MALATTATGVMVASKAKPAKMVRPFSTTLTVEMA